VRRLDAAFDSPANDIGEITESYTCDQSGVKPPHSKILAASLLNFSAACWKTQKAQRSRKEERRKELSAIFASAFAPFALN